jgi:hypothetical protein
VFFVVRPIHSTKHFQLIFKTFVLTNFVCKFRDDFCKSFDFVWKIIFSLFSKSFDDFIFFNFYVFQPLLLPIPHGVGAFTFQPIPIFTFIHRHQSQSLVGHFCVGHPLQPYFANILIFSNIHHINVGGK